MHPEEAAAGLGRVKEALGAGYDTAAGSGPPTPAATAALAHTLSSLRPVTDTHGQDPGGCPRRG